MVRAGDFLCAKVAGVHAGHGVVGKSNLGFEISVSKRMNYISCFFVKNVQ